MFRRPLKDIATSTLLVISLSNIGIKIECKRCTMVSCSNPQATVSISLILNAWSMIDSPDLPHLLFPRQWKRSRARWPSLLLRLSCQVSAYNDSVTPNTTMPTHNTHQTLQCQTHQYKEAMLHRGLYTCQMDTCCALQRRGGAEQRASLLCRVKPSRMCCKVECCMYIVV